MTDDSDRCFWGQTIDHIWSAGFTSGQIWHFHHQVAPDRLQRGAGTQLCSRQGTERRPVPERLVGSVLVHWSSIPQAFNKKKMGVENTWMNHKSSSSWILGPFCSSSVIDTWWTAANVSWKASVRCFTRWNAASLGLATTMCSGGSWKMSSPCRKWRWATRIRPLLGDNSPQLEAKLLMAPYGRHNLREKWQDGQLFWPPGLIFGELFLGVVESFAASRGRAQMTLPSKSSRPQAQCLRRNQLLRRNPGQHQTLSPQNGWKSPSADRAIPSWGN